MISRTVHAFPLPAKRLGKQPCQDAKSRVRPASGARSAQGAVRPHPSSSCISQTSFFVSLAPARLTAIRWGDTKIVAPAGPGAVPKWEQVGTEFGNRLFQQNQSLTGAVPSVPNSSRARVTRNAHARTRARKGIYLGNNGNNGNKPYKSLISFAFRVPKSCSQLFSLGTAIASPARRARISAVPNKIDRRYAGAGPRSALQTPLAVEGGRKVSGSKFAALAIGAARALVSIGGLELGQLAGAEGRFGLPRSSIGARSRNGGFLRVSECASSAVGTALLERPAKNGGNARFLGCRRKLGRLTGAALRIPIESALDGLGGIATRPRGAAPLSAARLSPSTLPREAGRISDRSPTVGQARLPRGAQSSDLETGPGVGLPSLRPRDWILRQRGRGCAVPWGIRVGRHWREAGTMRREAAHVK